MNLIYGENAQGKTNLLEAIAYLSSARSHRARYDREMIRLDGEDALIRGAVESRGREFLLEARLARGRRRQLSSNGVRLKTAGELSGILNTVLFCPEDLLLIREGAAARRRFLDCAICQLRPRYAQALAEYNRLYEHKTRILRDWPENPSLLETLEDFNVRMAQTGALVIRYRAYFVRRLQEAAPAVHRDFSGGREELSLTYQTVSSVSDPTAAPQKILEQLRDHQERHRQAELDSRQCLSGPHKDDLLVELDGRSAKTYGSQGQTRTAALSLSGTSSSRRPGSTPCCCWTMCSQSWMPGGRPSSSTTSRGDRSSSPAVRRRSWRAWRGARPFISTGALWYSAKQKQFYGAGQTI